MTTLEFRDELVENTFTYTNSYIYAPKRSTGHCFAQGEDNYPFVMKGGTSDTFELEFSAYAYQLRNRLLNTKKIKEVMNSSRVPLIFIIKNVAYLIGKGFLSTYDPRNPENNKLLFLACVDGRKVIREISQVKFYVSKEVYNEQYKPMHPAIKDIISQHPGDVMMVKNILDYVGLKLVQPRGGSISELERYKEAVVRSSLEELFPRTTITTESSSSVSTVNTTPDFLTAALQAVTTPTLPEEEEEEWEDEEGEGSDIPF